MRDRITPIAVAAAFAALLCASTPVQLPSGEDPTVWEGALAMAGFEPGDPGPDTWVRLVPGGAEWQLHVRDRDGVLHEVAVPPPRSAQDREDIVWLAVSLLHPSGAEDDPAAMDLSVVSDDRPSSTVPARAPRPRPEPEPEPEPLEPPPPALEPPPPPPAEEVAEPGEPEGLVAAAEPPPPEDPTPAPEPAPAEPVVSAPVAVSTSVDAPDEPWEARRIRLLGSVGLGVDSLIGALPTIEARLRVGIDIRGWLRTGVTGSVIAPSVAPDPSAPSLLWSGELVGGAWLSPDPRRRIWIGLETGARWYDYIHVAEDPIGEDISALVDASLASAGIDGDPGEFGSSGHDSGEVAGAIRISVAGMARASETLAISPWGHFQLEIFDGAAPAGRPDLIDEVGFDVRFGVSFLLLRHVGRGLGPR